MQCLTGGNVVEAPQWGWKLTCCPENGLGVEDERTGFVRIQIQASDWGLPCTHGSCQRRLRSPSCVGMHLIINNLKLVETLACKANQPRIAALLSCDFIKER